MKVLMETITGRKGIKNFEEIEDFGDFMDKNAKKIKHYKIFEDNEKIKTFSRKSISQQSSLTKDEIQNINNQLQNLTDKCLQLSKEVLGVFFSSAKSKKEYAKLQTASSKLVKIISILKSCIKK